LKTLNRTHVYLSTIAPDAAALAQKYQVGLEIAEYCTAYNMDAYFDQTHPLVQEKLTHIEHRILHAPFNELFPCAIDPKARELAASRYQQALQLAAQYQAGKVVIHTGSAPSFYYDCWFEEQSILFWKAFMKSYQDDAVICLENVLDPHPEPLLHILEAAQDSRLRICLDVGHAHAYSKRPVKEWLELLSPYITHFHIHNNDRSYDAHRHLYDTAEHTMDMAALLHHAAELCPEATFTLEITEPEADLRWLQDQGLLF